MSDIIPTNLSSCLSSTPSSGDLFTTSGIMQATTGGLTSAEEAYRLYEAVFARQPDLPGLKYHADLLDSGVSLHTVTEAFVDSAEFRGIYGAQYSEEAVLKALYQNALGRAPDEAGFNYWKGLLDSDKVDIADVIVAFVECPENEVIYTVQPAGTDYTFW